MTISVTFGADFVATNVNIGCQQAADSCALSLTNINTVSAPIQQRADTCALAAFTDMEVAITGNQARDTCAITIGGGVTASMNLQQAADTCSIFSLDVPNPSPILTPPIGSGFRATVAEERYTVRVTKTPEFVNED